MLIEDQINPEITLSNGSICDECLLPGLALFYTNMVHFNAHFSLMNMVTRYRQCDMYTRLIFEAINKQESNI